MKMNSTMNRGIRRTRENNSLLVIPRILRIQWLSPRFLGIPSAALLLLLVAAVETPGAPPFVYESASELQSGGDFNGDGLADLLIVDKTTGAYRIAYQLSPGNY